MRNHSFRVRVHHQRWSPLLNIAAVIRRKNKRAQLFPLFLFVEPINHSYSCLPPRSNNFHKHIFSLQMSLCNWDAPQIAPGSTNLSNFSLPESKDTMVIIGHLSIIVYVTPFKNVHWWCSQGSLTKEEHLKSPSKSLWQDYKPWWGMLCWRCTSSSQSCSH